MLSFLLAVVDARGVFPYMHIGSPGSIGDAETFIEAKLAQKLASGKWLPVSQSKVIEGVSVRPYIVGDGAFCSPPTLMEGFPGNPAEDTLELAYNDAHVC